MSGAGEDRWKWRNGNREERVPGSLGGDTRKTRETRARARAKRKNAAEKKTNLNKKKEKRQQEKGGNPNAIKSPTMAPAEKVFALRENAAAERISRPGRQRGREGLGQRRAERGAEDAGR